MRSFLSRIGGAETDTNENDRNAISGELISDSFLEITFMAVELELERSLQGQGISAIGERQQLLSINAKS